MNVRNALRAADVGSLSWVLLTVAAVAVGVGGYLHGHLFHEGYSRVDVVGPLFLLNLIGSAVVIGLLILRRVALFIVGALGISLGSLVSIIISHTTSFFGFAENRFDSRATAIVVAEAVATALCLLAIVLTRRDLLREDPRVTERA